MKEEESVLAMPKPTKKRILFVAFAVLLLMGGAAGGLYVARFGWVPPTANAQEPDALRSRSGTDNPLTYVTIEQGFTSNLKDSDSFVQASVTLSTRGGEKVAAAIKANEPALRSVVLRVLADHTYDAISTNPGRQALLGTLRTALDSELRSKVGFGGIDNVYFTAFVLQ